MYNIETLEMILNYLRVYNGAIGCNIENCFISYWVDNDKIITTIYKIIAEMQEKGIDISAQVCYNNIIKEQKGK